MRGEDLEQAYAGIHHVGLAVSYPTGFTFTYDQQCFPIVTSSRPSAGTLLQRGTTVTLLTHAVFCAIASPALPVGRLPTYRVPNFVGKRVPTAITWDEHRNLYWSGRFPALRSGRARTLFANYVVTHQAPSAGARIRLGIRGTDSFTATPLVLTAKPAPR
jgi:hypothetical protein